MMLPNNTHGNILPGFTTSLSVDHAMILRFLRFSDSCTSSANPLILQAAQLSRGDARCVHAFNILSISREYQINNYSSLRNMFSHLYSLEEGRVLQDLMSNIIPDFTEDELSTMF